MMLKLYKREGRKITEYHEAWVAGSWITQHWGPLGTEGQTRKHRRTKGLHPRQNLLDVLAGARAAGFRLLNEDRLVSLLVEYAIEGDGTRKDLTKRHALEDRLNNRLGWTGLGHCDGGSIGGGTMEVCCRVVDEEVAVQVIKTELKGTRFGDYRRIYAEDDEAA